MKRKKIKILIFLVSLFAVFGCENCECLDDNTIPPEGLCDTGLFIMRSEEIGQPLFSLDSLSKPINIPLAFQNIRQDGQDDNQFDVFNRPSNYDAYDVINNQYYIEFPLQQRLYKYDIDTQTRQEIIVAGFYSAPVFNNGNLFTITIDNFGYATDPANYTIESINTNDGSLTTLASNSFPLQSYFNWESMSSTSDGNGIIYFISGSNLITFNTNTMTTQYIELVPDFDFATNNQIFFGLEMRNNGNLLAIRDRNTDQGEGLELVEININNPAENPTIIFDFKASGIVLNPEFYATTYDACDDTYYITSRRDAATTNFYEIDLNSSTFKTENFDFYLMGIENKN
ncbi:hypothetical protein [Marixanthomonas ophiurae]|uniref:DUF4221 domain-containing protein n=1 Tax=Marixanthomonas ophiurae TaxID=387659 RepID=A0A3E1Q9I2_9FLAO|nr:hypothetical protein [Marixanthomonas ophiurae]RFN58797.1 hypothetical protein DZ858_01575 [Marixanthomonas ophiurae]